MPKRTRASSVRPAPTSPASPTISPARTSSVTLRTPLAAQPTPRSDSTTSPRLALRRWINGRDLAADHQLDERGFVHLVHRTGADAFAVAQDRHAVGDSENLFQAMGDVDDAHAAGTEAAHDAKKQLPLPSASAMRSARP